MRIKITTDTRVNNKYEIAGTIVETDDASGNRLLMLGWAVAAEETPKKAKATKKAKEVSE